MLFANKTVGGHHNRSKTPQRNTISGSSTHRVSKKDANNQDSAQRDKSGMKEQPGFKFKTKDSFQILQALELIYNDLNFNEYDVFPLQNIEKAKKNIQDLLNYLGEEPTCRYHKDLLNLYCESDK